MAARRDDIVPADRAQIATEMMSPYRPRGRVNELAEMYQLSRQALYGIGAKGKDGLRQVLTPGPHGPTCGPQAREEAVLVTKERLQRSVLTLSEVGVSQRDVTMCVAEMLDAQISLGWVNGELSDLEVQAQQANDRLQPVGHETLCGDEIFSNGSPNLLVVGNESLYIYALTRQDERDGDTWGCVLLDVAETARFASDAGTGLAAGAKAADMNQHQLDWDHLLRPLWGQAARLESQAYAALTKVEERAALFDKSHTSKRLAQHLARWKKLVAVADQKIEKLDDFCCIARRVDDCFALIDLVTGELTNAEASITCLQALGQEMAALAGRVYQKLAKNLQNWATALFAYQRQLRQALTPLIERYGQPAITALCRIWQCEADAGRRRLSLPEKQERQQIWQQALDEAFAYLGEDRL